MAMGRQKDGQGDLMVSWSEMPRSPGHAAELGVTPPQLKTWWLELEAAGSAAATAAQKANPTEKVIPGVEAGHRGRDTHGREPACRSPRSEALSYSIPAKGDTATLSKTLAKAEANLEAVDAAPTSEDPAECVADKGYHSRAVLRALNDSPWKTRIAAPKQTGFSRWHGDEAARRAVTNNRARLKSGVAREAFKLRAEIVERCFAHNLDRGGMRRTWLRGRENVHKRYLLHVAGHNLSLLMRQLIGAGTPREAVAGGYGGIFVLLTPTGAMLVARGVSQSGRTAFAAAFLIWE